MRLRWAALTVGGLVLATPGLAQSPPPPLQPSYRSPATMMLITAGGPRRFGVFPDIDACKRSIETAAMRSLAGEAAAGDVKLLCVETGFAEDGSEPRRRRR